MVGYGGRAMLAVVRQRTTSLEGYWVNLGQVTIHLAAGGESEGQGDWYNFRFPAELCIKYGVELDVVNKRLMFIVDSSESSRLKNKYIIRGYNLVM